MADAATDSTAIASSVSAGSLINSMKRRIHAFVEHHTMLEALVEEKDVLLGQKQELIDRLKERVTYYETKYASLEQNAQAVEAATGKPLTAADVAKSQITN